MIGCLDLRLMAATIRAFAEGEPHEARVAVGHVIANRYRIRHLGAPTLSAVCFQLPAWERSRPVPITVDEGIDETAAACYLAALEALTTDDTTGGSLHFRHERNRPRWARGATPAARRGDLVFYSTIDRAKPHRGVRAGELLRDPERWQA